MNSPLTYDAIMAERLRQEALKAIGKWKQSAADDMSNHARLAVLMEEVGEVALDLNEWLNGKLSDEDLLDHLETELVQVAAVCVAWIDGFDAENKGLR